MTAALLLTFDCARRLTDGLHGLIAASVLTCSFVPYFGYDARPYAIFAMFAALALWVWTYTGVDEKTSAILFGAVLFLSFSFHYYAVLLLAPFALWEISCWRPWQLPSLKLMAGVVGLAAVLALHLPLFLSLRKFSTSLPSRGSFSELMTIFPVLFPEGLFLIALVMVWIVLVNRKDGSIVLPPLQSGKGIGWLFLCIPLAGIVVRLKTHAFAFRYFIDVVPGVAVAISCFLWRRFRSAPVVALGILLILTTWGLAKQLYVVRNIEAIRIPGSDLSFGQRDYLNLEGTLRREGKRFSVFSNPFVFLTARYYSRNQCSLLVPANFEREPKSFAHNTVSLVLGLGEFSPMQVESPNDLREHAAETALIQPTPEVLETLKEAGFKIETRFSKPLEVVYLK